MAEEKKNGGPYREHEPKKPVREPWWLAPKRALRAALSWARDTSRPLVIAMAAAIVPSVLAHMAGVWSWHWTAAHALIAAAVWAALAILKDGGHPAPWVIGALAYVVATAFMVTRTCKTSDLEPPVCVDKIESAAPTTECEHPDHMMTPVWNEGTLYAKCTCRR